MEARRRETGSEEVCAEGGTAGCTWPRSCPSLDITAMRLSSMIIDEVRLSVPELEPVMPNYDVLWNYEDEDGNVAHTEHGLTLEDVNVVLWLPTTGSVGPRDDQLLVVTRPMVGYICVVS